jgi:hypothetical protein
MKNWKGFGLILRYYPGTHLEGLRKLKKRTQVGIAVLGSEI